MTVGHYRLQDGELRMTRGGGECFPYLVEIDGQPVLCVIEAGAFHRYAIAPTAAARLAEGAVEYLARRERAAAMPLGGPA